MHKGSQLAVFLENLHWSPERLAREINRRYGEGTVSLKAPYGWAKGAYPRGQVPGFVAAILSDQLGRTIDISHIWPQRFPAPEPGGVGDPALGPPWSEEHVGRILRPLLDREEENGEPWPSEPVPGAVLVSLAVDWLTAESRLVSARSEGAEVSTEMVDMLSSRIARLRTVSTTEDTTLVMNWVVHELRWALRMTESTAYDAPTGRRLFGAVAELAQLAGWLAEDLGQYVRGQHYLLGALRASDLAGDRNLGAYVLSCLSYQLTKCGNGQDALRLVKLADVGMDDAVPGMPHSLLASREARMYAHFADDPAAQADQAGAPVRPVGSPGTSSVGHVRLRDGEGRLPRPGSRIHAPVIGARSGAVTSPGRGLSPCNCDL
ncbi:hypothetical protein ACQEU8_04570 [Streptomyces sp. CA-250714]|uniref:hypothetical protein n=1 Tax=Streptomyces sp. CA-250714 TaxID=3240060 RepID=UPI003D93E3DA